MGNMIDAYVLDCATALTENDCSTLINIMCKKLLKIVALISNDLSSNRKENVYWLYAQA